jgi:hypothetical protein
LQANSKGPLSLSTFLLLITILRQKNNSPALTQLFIK